MNSFKKYPDYWFILGMALLFLLVLSLTSCCPKIGETVQTNTITRVDTVFMADTVTVPEMDATGSVDLRSICDSLFAGRDTIQQIAAKPQQIRSVRFVRDSTGMYTLTAQIASYEILVDSLRSVISRHDSTSVVKTITVNRCERKFHYFTVGFFYLVVGLSVVYLVARYFRIIGK